MSDEQDSIDELLSEIHVEVQEHPTNQNGKDSSEIVIDADTVDSTEIEYIRFDNPVYHLKYKGIEKTICGYDTSKYQYRQSDREPELLDPCKRCHGEGPKTIEDQMIELRSQISRMIPDVEAAETQPGLFRISEIKAILNALPIQTRYDLSSERECRKELSTVLAGVQNKENDYCSFSKDELVVLVEGLEGDGLISSSPNVFIRTNQNLIKRCAISSFSPQRRGGKGHLAVSFRDEEANSVFLGTPRDSLLLFSNHGKVHKLQAHKIPELERHESGQPLSQLIDLSDGESIEAIITMRQLSDQDVLAFATRDGYVKRVNASNFENIHRGGIFAIELNDDELRDVTWTDGESELFVGTNTGRVIRFEEVDARVMGREARGVKGIKLSSGDEVIGIESTAGESTTQILTITANGYGKRTPIENYKLQKRGGKGLLDISTDERNGEVADFRAVPNQTNLIVLSRQGQLINTNVKDVSSQNRNTKGVTVIQIEEGDSVVGLDTVAL